MKYDRANDNKNKGIRRYNHTNNEDILISYIIYNYVHHNNNMLHYCIYFFFFDSNEKVHKAYITHKYI